MPSEPVAIEQARLRTVLATIALNVVGVVVLSVMPWSDWRSGVALNVLDNTILLTHTIRRRDRLMAHLMLFGFVVGFVELIADAWLVDVTRTLDYSPGGGPMIWRSPLWMPFAWEVVAVQFGYVGLRLAERFGGLGLLLTGLLGAINIPFYEELARRTNWWVYSGCRMVLHTPYYIIVGEFGIAMFLAGFALMLRRTYFSKTVFFGVLAGWSILICYAGAYRLIDGR